MSFWDTIAEVIVEVFEGEKPEQCTLMPPQNQTPTQPQAQTQPQPQAVAPKIITPLNPDILLPDWSVVVAAHHNVRVICDLVGLTVAEKNEMAATVMEESGFKIHEVNYNYGFNAQGQRILFSTDYGICQWNDHYHGKEITPDQAMNNPEFAVRLMGKYWLAGRTDPAMKDQWVAHKTGAYKKWLGKV